jgi:LacI family transcriptional regulator
MARPTISEVAKAARVSKSTVSRVLNGGGGYVSAATRDAVMRVIEELNYRPSSLARGLSLQRTHTIGVLIADVSHPFSGEMIRGVEEIAFAQQCDLFLCNMMHDPSRYARLIHALLDKQVDGVLVLTSTLPEEFLAMLTASHVPLVALDFTTRPPLPNAGWVRINFLPGIQEAVDHLLALGHRQLGYITSPLHRRNVPSVEHKQEAFVQALRARDIDPHTIRLAEGNQQIEGGKRALHELMQGAQPPTAILAGDDYAAFGVLWAARDLGIRLPDELSVIGIDNLPMAADVSPPLTTIIYPRYAVGRVAATMLFELIQNKRAATEQLPASSGLPAPWVEQLSTSLLLRASTAAVRELAPEIVAAG